MKEYAQLDWKESISVKWMKKAHTHEFFYFWVPWHTQLFISLSFMLEAPILHLFIDDKLYCTIAHSYQS